MSEPDAVTIMVVDDNEIKRYSVVRLLRQAGFQTLEAATGEEALSMMARRPDLIVLDVKLPGISGFDVCRSVKSNPELSNVKVLHVSATFIDSDHPVEGLAHGADGYLVQPVEPGELVETVRALLRMREAEEATRRTAREWRATFDALNDGILLVDEQGAVLRCNRAMTAILGKPFNAIIGASYQDSVPAPLASLLTSFLADAGSAPSNDAPMIILNDREYLVTVNAVPNETGRSTGAVCILADMTERKRLEEELRQRAEALAQADRAKDEFLAMLGHELRNPLGAISNALEVLRVQNGSHGPNAEGASPATTESSSVSPGSAMAARAREILDRQVATMKRLVDDLLDVARVTSGKIGLRCEPILLDDVVAGVLRNLRPQISAKGLRLRCELDRGVVVSADAVRLEQSITNLVTNAIRYTDEGVIHVMLHRKGDHAVLKVRDTGMGIRSETLPIVFDMFSQGERDQVRTQGGLGVGLTLVRGIVQLHGGTVKAESKGEGQGSTFTVTLPLCEAVPERARPMSQSTAQSGCRQVLVVDDNTDAAETMTDIITAWGHSAAIAFDGPSALEMVQGHRPEVILLDIGLPGMDGYEVARRLRSAPEGDGLLLIAVTGYGQAEDHARTLAAGFDHHLAKPVNLDVLKQILAGNETGVDSHAQED